MTENIEKVIRDGKVAVVYSPGFGAGWSTWTTGLSPFNPKVVEMVEKGEQNKITDDWCKENIGLDVYCGGVEDLEIEWLPIGTDFYIDECDGSESIVTSDYFVYKA